MWGLTPITIMEQDFKITIDKKDKYDILNLSGNLDTYVVNDLKYTIESAFSSDRYNLILDLGKVNNINSTALGILVGRLHKATEHKGEIVLTNLNVYIRKVFDMVGAGRLFSIFEDVKDAEDYFIKKLNK